MGISSRSWPICTPLSTAVLALDPGIPGQGAADAVQQEVQEVVGAAEVAEGVQELLDVALQEGAAVGGGEAVSAGRPAPGPGVCVGVSVCRGVCTDECTGVGVSVQVCVQVTAAMCTVCAGVSICV